VSRRLQRLPEMVELLTFVAAAEERSIRRAAVRLHMTPAGVAKRLDHLEAVVDRELVVRGPRGLQLTADGRVFYEHASEILDDARMLVSLERQGAPNALRGVERVLSMRAGRSTEAILRDAERLLAHVLDASSDALAILELPGETLLEANDAFCDLVGRARERLVGTTLDAFGVGVRAGEAGTTDIGGRRIDFDARPIDLSGHEVVLVRLTDRTAAWRLDAHRRRWERLASLLRLVNGAEKKVVVDEALDAIRAELRLDTAAVVGDNVCAVRSSGDLHAAVDRLRPRWLRGEIAVERRDGFLTVCAPIGSTAAVVAARGVRDDDLDEDERGFAAATAIAVAAVCPPAGKLAA
jgi:DNA-binding transcriptional LysR family regulator